MHSHIDTLVDRYVESIRLAGHPLQRVAVYRRQLEYVTVWASAIGIDGPDQLTALTGECFYDHLFDENDLLTAAPIGPRIRRERLSKLRRFLAFLHLHAITAADLSLAVPVVNQHGTRTPKHALTTKTLSPQRPTLSPA